jgi:coproporphyrinogen III oxidase-like Fe-S oxidoreductase
MTNLAKNKVRLFNQLFSIENNWQNVLYVHTPFCIQKCFYCVYGSKVPSGQQEMDHFYNHVITSQIAQYKITLEKVKFDQVSFGGGTPTIINAYELENLFKKIPGFENIPLKAAEASPYTITDQHIDLFDKYRFTYVSLGVQTLSEPILKAQNRIPVSKEKLNHICRRLDQCNIISNLDLIFFLDTGTIDDMSQANKDLEEVMAFLKPVSITIHSNYKSKKSHEKQEAMRKSIKEMIGKYPEYQCVNSLLDAADIQSDMIGGAEFRLMRTHRDFNFYMIGKIPAALRYGHNVLSLGEYENFKPRSNFFYISDFIDKYALQAMFKRNTPLSIPNWQI